LLAQDGHWFGGQAATADLRWGAKKVPESRLAWTLGYEDLSIASGAVRVGGDVRPDTIRIDLPPVRVRTSARFRYRLLRANAAKSIAEGEASVVLYPKDLLGGLSQRTGNRSIVAWDTGKDLSTVLTAGGIRHNLIQRESELRLASADIVLVATGEIRDKPFSQSRLTSYAERGSNVLILEQRDVKALAGIPLTTVPAKATIVWSKPHPLLTHLRRYVAPKDVMTFRALRISSISAINGELLSLARFDRRGESDVSQAALAGVVPTGKGQIVFCQLPLPPFGSDPRSQLFLSDVISYFCAERERTSLERERISVPVSP
ncbi:MAG: hypothetical protein OER86_01825, partial [Phycisphaerae bacterium]|nr:hypothetical protein [Phycisphaerae bacterium]